MAASVWDWSVTPLTNQNSDTNINWLEGTQLPSTVNDSSRAMMARIAELLKDLSAVSATAGTANAQTLTMASNYGALGDYKLAVFIATLGVTGTATLQVNGLAVKAWRKFTAAGITELETGDVVAGQRCICAFSDAPGGWILLNPGTAAINAAAITALLATAAFTEASQDATGAMLDTTLEYVDATPLLRRAGLTGDVTAPAGSNATTIAADAVTNAKLADMAAATLKGSVAGGDPADLTATQTTALLNVFTTALKGLVPASGAGAGLTYLSDDGVFKVVPGSGTPLTDGNKGDVTVTAAGATWTINAGVVTYAKLQDISATDRLLGRDTAAAGDTEELTVGGGIEFTGTGGIQSSAFTGDVTKALGGTALTIPNDTVTYAKLQNISTTKRVLGRDTAGAGDTEEVSATSFLDWIGTPAQGDIHYRNVANWVILSAGTAGEVLQTGGAAANPSWSKRHSKLNVDLTQVGNVGAGEDDLITYSLPANTLAAAGDGLRITAWGNLANNANVKTIKFYWGATVIVNEAAVANTAHGWRIEVLLFRRASNIQECSVRYEEDNVLVIDQFVAMTETDTAAITIKCTGTATTTNDIIQHGLSVELL